jgi:hypothetical protein
MSEQAAKPKRDWQQIAAEAAREADSQKLLKLAQELASALDEGNTRRDSECELNSDLDSPNDDEGSHESGPSE